MLDSLLFAPAIIIGLIYYRHSFGTPIGYVWSAIFTASSSVFSIDFHARYGATPGKSLMRCRVLTSGTEEKITLRVAMARESPWLAVGTIGVLEGNWAKLQMPAVAVAMGYAVSAWILADMAIAVFHPKRRALHDLLAGTVVVKEKPNKAPEPTTRSVTPRAFVPRSECNSRTVLPIPARVAPKRVVAHL
jgi:uncharacterized RDD family membrane protein YckC